MLLVSSNVKFESTMFVNLAQRKLFPRCAFTPWLCEGRSGARSTTSAGIGARGCASRSTAPLAMGRAAPSAMPQRLSPK